MNKLMVACAAGAAGLICGCYSPKVTTAKYSTKAFAEVALAPNSSIKIVSQGANALIPVLTDSLAKSDQKFTVTEGPAQYWMFIKGLGDRRVDTPEQATASTKIKKDPVGFVEGKPCTVQDRLAAVQESSFSIAMGVNVAIYQADGLVPVAYFEIPVYDGELSPVGAPAVTMGQVAAYLAQQVTLRVKDVTVTGDRDVEVDIPAEASSEMIKAIGDKAVSAQKDVKGVFAAAKKAIPQPFVDFAKAVQAGTYKETDVQTKLCDYYILALARELGCLDPKQLKEVYAMQLGILQLAETDSLAKCCPTALARLEYKLACLGSKLN